MSHSSSACSPRVSAKVLPRIFEWSMALRMLVDILAQMAEGHFAICSFASPRLGFSAHDGPIVQPPHRRNIIHSPTTQSRIPPAFTSEIFSLKSATPSSSSASAAADCVTIWPRLTSKPLR